MTVDQAIDLARHAVLLALLLAAPVLVAGWLTSVVTSALQTVTQLQDQTLGFAPRFIVVVVVTLLALPWGLELLVEYASELFRSIPGHV